MEKFSVLLSVYWKEKPDWLRVCLDSIIRQTVRPDEVVIMEDGPLTAELDAVVDEFAERYHEVKVVALPKNGGLGPALNEGLKHCSYDLVARMDADDICKPNRFERELQMFEKDADLDVCCSWIEEFKDSTDNVVNVRRLPERHEELYEFGKKRNPVNHPSCMFRKKAVIENGNYVEFQLFEDYYLWSRMMVNGCKFYCIQESLLLFRYSRNLIKRRGGLIYAWTEFKFQRKLHEIGYINRSTFLRNVLIRAITRLVPCDLRVQIYKRIRKMK